MVFLRLSKRTCLGSVVLGGVVVGDLSSGTTRTLHLLGLSVQFGVRASEDYDHPFLLFIPSGDF